MRTHEKLRRLEAIGWEIEFEEYQCKTNSSRSRKHLNELKKERAELNRQLDVDYNDPITRMVTM